MKVKVTHSCLTLRDPMAYLVHGILQARILEWTAIPFSRGSSQPRDRTQVSHIAARFFTSWTTREAQGNCRSRQWYPTPVLLPGKSHGRKSLVGCSSWGRQESDTTERLHFHFLLASLVAQRLKHLPPMWDTWVRSLGQEDPLAKEMATHSSILAWKTHGWRSLVGCSPWSHSESNTTERLHFHFSLSCIGEGNGNPLQCSCQDNPRDRGALWAAVYWVTHSQTRLKRLSSSEDKKICVLCLLIF